MAATKEIPFCPLISAGQAYPQVCLQEECAWYMKPYKTCGVYLLAHDAALNIKSKQQKG